jgi:transposase
MGAGTSPGYPTLNLTVPQRKPGKSDRLDALAVARLLREEATTLPLVLPDEEAVATVQLWSRLREDVVADMTRVRNRLHALLLLCDPTYKTRIPDLTTRTGIRACQAYTAPGQGVLARHREQAVRQVAAQLTLWQTRSSSSTASSRALSRGGSLHSKPSRAWVH